MEGNIKNKATLCMHTSYIAQCSLPVSQGTISDLLGEFILIFYFNKLDAQVVAKDK